MMVIWQLLYKKMNLLLMPLSNDSIFTNKYGILPFIPFYSPDRWHALDLNNHESTGQLIISSDLVLTKVRWAMRKNLPLTYGVYFLLFFTSLNMHAQTFSGVDALGRRLLQFDDVGPLKKDCQVGVFYFLWQGDNNISATNWDLSKIVKEHPEVLKDFKNSNWGGGGMYYWGEPIYGYYSAEDFWVQLRSMQLLTDASVDFVVIDATNTFVYPKQADILMKAMNYIRQQGKNPPRIVFYTNTASGATMQKAYDAFYKPGAPYYHPDCWYYLDGKPLIIGISAEAGGKDYENFFTYRESQWPNEPQKVNGWPWIEFVRPQKVYFNSKGEKEIVNVSVAQHPNWKEAGMGGSAFYGNRDNWGRSYHKNSHGNPENDMAYGLNFQEQWDFALRQSTPFIFVTGWNEWIAGRFPSNDGNPAHSWFCDQASPEYSRDIEPAKHRSVKDNYYMQLVNNIRRYKGLQKPTKFPSDVTISRLSDWKNVVAIYEDYTGDIMKRDHRAAPSVPEIIYTNHTGQNDLKLLKVASDRSNVYFLAETVKAITPDKGIHWMVLYLVLPDAKGEKWQGYNYRVVHGKELQKYADGRWLKTASVKSSMTGNQLMITVPRMSLGLTFRKLKLEFKWSDNMQDDTDCMDWYVNGDVAPGGRFNLLYQSK